MITASGKLRPYFQDHKIEVLTDQPLRNIMHNPKASGRLIKWTIDTTRKTGIGISFIADVWTILKRCICACSKRVWP